MAAPLSGCFARALQLATADDRRTAVESSGARPLATARVSTRSSPRPFASNYYDVYAGAVPSATSDPRRREGLTVSLPSALLRHFTTVPAFFTPPWRDHPNQNDSSDGTMIGGCFRRSLRLAAADYRRAADDPVGAVPVRNGSLHRSDLRAHAARRLLVDHDPVRVAGRRVESGLRRRLRHHYPCVDPVLGPTPPYFTWSVTNYAPLGPENGWGVDFSDGRIDWGGKPDLNYVRGPACVVTQ